MTGPADRDFTDEVTINADRAHVWDILSDPATMPKASPELFAMTRRKGPFRAGERFVGWNRRKAVVWPTVSRVVTVDEGRELTWHTSTSGATWSYTIAGDGDATVLREARTITDGVPGFATLFGNVLLGGMGNHADELESHVSATLAWIKAEAER